MIKLFIDVLVEINSLDKTFTYRCESAVSCGMRVLVPFGKRVLEGFVLKVYDTGDFDYEVKNVIKVIDNYPVINEEMFLLGDYISKKTLSSKIQVYQAMLPKALKAKNNVQVNKKYDLYVRVINDGDLTDKQREIYNYVKKKGFVLKSDVSKISSFICNKLIKMGILEVFKKEVYRINDDYVISKNDFDLTLDQKNALECIDLSKFFPYLIHGVTGSGKTLVYIKLIEGVLKEGKTAILLVPEISLTAQTLSAFRSYFGKKVAILHSGLSDGEKYDEWRKIERGGVSIAIGARSAVFAPFTNLGIVIIDEEHSDTYKQENVPRYDAIMVALWRCKYYNIPLVLGSATPSVISYTRACVGIYKLINMKNRVNNMPPKVDLIDMKDEFKKGNRVISSTLKDKINDRLSKGQQVIILLNRRGFSTVITCHDCGFVHKCPNCDIPLTYHKKNNSMRCHYCGYTSFKFNVCPKCKSKNIDSLGMGTEKLEEIIKEMFLNAKTIRMDVDTTRTKGAHDKIIKDFKDFKYNVLIGTQMIAKGLDFPNVTLVGVINGDASLNVPDFRSSERTFDLLSQVAGRAGRGDLAGDVVIQGFNVNHYSIVAAMNENYDLFYKEEMKIRKALSYPPYFNLCLIKLSFKDSEVLEKEALKVLNYLKKNLNNTILGPTFCTIPRVNNVYFMQIIIKYKNTSDIRDSLLFLKERYFNSKVRLDIDLNPFKI